MAIKFDQQKTKQQLFHVSISLATVLICMTYMQFQKNWANVGNLWNSLILPIVSLGELLKVILARYYARKYDHGGQQTQQQKQRLKKPSQKLTLKEIAGGLLLQCLCTVLYAFICIILGAPVLQNYEQTFVLALLLTLQTTSPTIFLLGGSGALQVCFCEKPDTLTKSEDTALGLFKYNALGGILGAWAGSVVAPLDWDREWQAYPIPNVVGALIGAALGNIYACSRILYATAKVNNVEHDLLYLRNKIRGLEDALDNPNIVDSTLRKVIEAEISNLKAEVDKHKENVKALHKDKSQQMAIITVLVFIILCTFTLYRLFYSWY